MAHIVAPLAKNPNHAHANPDSATAVLPFLRATSEASGVLPFLAASSEAFQPFLPFLPEEFETSQALDSWHVVGSPASVPMLESFPEQDSASVELMEQDGPTHPTY